MSLAVIEQVKSEAHVKEAHTLLLYHSLSDEVYTHDLIDQLRAEGKAILLPRVIDKENVILCRYTGPQDLREGAFHIMEPCGEVFPKEAYSEIDVAIVPGMSFDPQGHRLGRGKGYYDRLLHQLPRTYKIGVCFDFQKTALVPTEEYDITMDKVL